MQAHSFQGHAGRAGFEEQVKTHFAHQGEVGGGVAAAAALEVFAEDDVEPPVQVILHLPMPTHAAGDQWGVGLETGDEKPPPDGDLAGDQIEGFALAEGYAGEAAPLAAACETGDVPGDPAARGFEPPVAFFSLLQIGMADGGEVSRRGWISALASGWLPLRLRT